MGGGVAHHLARRVPRIKFPQRHGNPSGSVPHPQGGAAAGGSGGQQQSVTMKSEVPAAPTNTAVGGKASLQPKRTPVSQHEIDAILLGGSI